LKDKITWRIGIYSGILHFILLKNIKGQGLTESNWFPSK
jgi:hypothetical protein